MKVLLVCCGGISTAVLAKKMNQFAASNHRDDEVLAVKESRAAEYIVLADIVALAPQAIFFHDELKALTEKNNIPLYLITQEQYSKMDSEHIYLELHHIYQKKSEFTLDIKKSNENIRFFNAIYESVKTLFLVLFLIFAVGSICNLLLNMTNVQGMVKSVITCIYDVSMGVVSLYASFVLGYVFGKQLKLSEVFCAFISMSCLLLFLIDVNDYAQLDPIHIGYRTIDISSLGFSNLILSIIISISVITVFYFISMVLNYKQRVFEHPLIEHIMLAFPSAIVLLVCVVFRMFLMNLF